MSLLIRCAWILTLTLLLSGLAPGVVAESEPPTTEVHEIGLTEPEPVLRSCTLSGAGANPASASTSAGQPVDISPTFTGTLVNVGSPSDGTASIISATTIRYTPNAGFTGSDSFLYIVQGCAQCNGNRCTEPLYDAARITVQVN